MPVVTLDGVAYSYAALFEMFMQAQGLCICKVTQAPIHFFPNVCLPLHHFMMGQFKNAMKSRKQQDEADMMEKFGLEMPQVSSAPDDDGADGFLEDFECAVSKELAYEPCCLSSGTIVSACEIPSAGFKKDPDRLVACGLHGQKPKKAAVLEEMIKAKFPKEYSQRAADLAKQGVSTSAENATGTCNAFPQDDFIYWGLGCDGCGIWPIRTTAWYDADLKDKAGFHLCDLCMTLGFNKRTITGKFNQQRLPKNTMLEVDKSFAL
jgi:hypothetical protein